MIWMVLDIWEMEIEIISEFWVIEKIQYTRIYGKLKRRNKLWSSGKLSNNNLDDEADYSYLCGGNNKFNSLTNQSQLQSQPLRKGRQALHW